MKRPFYYSTKKTIPLIFTVFFFCASVTKFLTAPLVIPRSIPVAYMALLFSCMIAGICIHAAMSTRNYQYSLLFFIILFSLYSIFEARFFLPLIYASRPLLSLFYLLYFFQFLSCLAVSGYVFKRYISWIFLVFALAFLLVLQPKIQIISFLLYSFIIFVNIYTYVLFLLLRFVTNQNTELQNARNKIVEQEKMTSIATFSAGLAHEINNPVNHMYGNLHFLESYHREFKKKCTEVSDDRLHAALDDMGTILQRYREGFDRIVQIIDTMKHAFPKKKNQPRRENISNILHNAVSIVGKSAPSDVLFTSDIPPDLFYHCNASDVLTLVINVSANAVDALKQSEANKEISVTARKQKTFLEIIIRDNGKGIETKDISEIFDPFFSTKGGKDNIGIGLTLCKSIVNQYNGEILIDSEPGKFTSVTIQLPYR